MQKPNWFESLLSFEFWNAVKNTYNNLILFRSYNICGENNVCCRVAKTTTETPSTTARSTTTLIPTTTRKTMLNFLSTILKPVPSTNFDRPQPETLQKCVSRKGKKIEKRILIDEDNYDDDEGALVGETVFAEFPWMLEVLKKNRKSGNYEYKCGGVLSK